MRLTLHDETHITLHAGDGALEIEGPAEFSPLHMLAASLATCTRSVLSGWATQAGLSLDDLAIELRWDYVEDPYRVGTFDMTLRWPSLPEARHAAAARVAEHCTVEATLREGAEIRTTIAGGGD